MPDKETTVVRKMDHFLIVLNPYEATILKAPSEPT
jgi:hypothetical protein